MNKIIYHYKIIPIGADRLAYRGMALTKDPGGRVVSALYAPELRLSKDSAREDARTLI